MPLLEIGHYYKYLVEFEGRQTFPTSTTRETELYVEITLARSGSPSTPATREENEANTSHVRRGESSTTHQRRCARVTVVMHSRNQ